MGTVEYGIHIEDYLIEYKTVNINLFLVKHTIKLNWWIRSTINI